MEVQWRGCGGVAASVLHHTQHLLLTMLPCLQPCQVFGFEGLTFASI